MIGPSSYSWRWETRDRLVDNGSKAVVVLFSEDTRLSQEDWAAGWLYSIIFTCLFAIRWFVVEVEGLKNHADTRLLLLHWRWSKASQKQLSRQIDATSKCDVVHEV